MLSRIHVNMWNIRKNKKDGGDRPVITVKDYKRNRYGHEIEIKGPSKLVYRPEKPLSCGARVWVETNDDVEVLLRDGTKVD